MSYTLEKLRTARQAIRQRDWQTAVGMIDALIERYENLAKLQKHYQEKNDGGKSDN
jgi:hypothetical protein